MKAIKHHFNFKILGFKRLYRDYYFSFCVFKIVAFKVESNVKKSLKNLFKTAGGTISNTILFSLGC
jgi:hypothetical protein